jgi:hypothetical protein
MPNRFESLIVKMLRMTRVEKTMKINSMEVGILLIFRCCATRPDAVYSTDDRMRLACVIQDGSSRNGRVARDKIEECDSRDVRALFLPVALFPPVSPVRLGQASAIAAEALMNNAG